ncbi:uncharacterized protein BT62DRAFT_1000108 [Guyanagaster necrorhizus]|uniref:Uncharacterized protein n=1 Tax=Guyanagaster necrorhizus TaxID=856835 RepID=A0A9P7W5L6_9AGAR|nr:uncharacterized protein BT62DRAFT_1000108 [Guyanagaster necrorhizus MCA 3950]KAG7452370.1 hypothetical protein BT62DRAFT_1000108 [Guyanagaster necrorhizus MCA 3950]
MTSCSRYLSLRVSSHGSESNATQCSPVIFEPTDTRLKRKRSSSEDDVPPKRDTLSPPPSTASVTNVPLPPISLSAPSATPSLRTSLPERAHAYHASLPSLTDGQRDWRKQRKKWFKCRCVWVYHTVPDCRNGQPESAMYRGILLQDGAILAPDAPEHYPEPPQLPYNDGERH